MKSKSSIFLITFFVAVIICIGILNFANSSSKKDYFFDRNYAKKNILDFEKTIPKMNLNSDYLTYIQSDSLIVENEKIGNKNDDLTYKLYFSDLSFKKTYFKTVDIPKIADIRLCNKNNLFFVENFRLFKHDLIHNKTNEIKLNNFKVVSLKSLIDSPFKFLCFGEFFDGNFYKTGFYIIDIESHNIRLLKVLMSSNNSNVISTSLQYSGSFCVNTDNEMSTYYCNKFSKIYFFSKEGLLINEMTTNDNVPLPKILKNKNGDRFFARGTTRNTNMGMFLKNNKIYVFSARSELNFDILIDEYALDSFKYIKSYRVKYQNFNSREINAVFLNKDKLLIGFATNYASFRLST